MVNVGKYTIYGCVLGFDTWSWLLVAVVLCFFLHARSVTVFFCGGRSPILTLSKYLETEGILAEKLPCRSIDCELFSFRVCKSCPKNPRMKWQIWTETYYMSRHFIENRGFVCLHPWYDFEWQNHAQNVGWLKKHTRWVNGGIGNSCLIYLKLGACMCTSIVSYNKHLIITLN